MTPEIQSTQYFDPGYIEALKQNAKIANLTPIDFVVKKMLKNSLKAINEHRDKDSFDWIYPLSKDFSTIDRSIKANTLTFTYASHESKGVRPHMEDVYFITEIKEGLLVGLFDGHGGSEVANFASNYVKAHFFATLEECEGNVYTAFNLLLKGLDQKVKENQTWNKMGTTSLICFIDNKTHVIYTATLGDSEANIYRTENLAAKSIPLSCIRDWSCKKEKARAKDTKGKIVDKNLNPYKVYPKAIVYEYNRLCINVSRAIGDKEVNGDREIAISCKPKVTMHQIKPNDLIILACDGLKDYVSESEILHTVEGDPKKVAENLVKKALIYKSQDNISLVVIKIT